MFFKNGNASVILFGVRVWLLSFARLLTQWKMEALVITVN